MKKNKKVARFSLVEFEEVTFSLSVEEISTLAGVTSGTVRRWLAGAVPIPYAVGQLFRQRAYGVPFEGWEGWRFGRDGLLYHPTWRRGFTGHELAGMFWVCQQVRGLEYRVRELLQDKARLQGEAERVQRQADYLRRQVKIEGLLGMCLVRIAG